MKKDIDFPEVTGVQIAIAKSVNALGESDWGVYIINKNLIELENVMIVSKGYESKSADATKTSTLRHMIELLGEQSFARVEPIDPAVFSLHNEFWVSYYILDKLFDKKFVIPPFSEFETEEIEELEMQGIVSK